MKSLISSVSILLVLVLASCSTTPTAFQGDQGQTNQAPGDSSAPATSAPKNNPPAAATPSKPAVRETELPAGTVLAVRLDQALSTARNQQGDTFSASLDEPVSVAGKEILPQGTKFTGRVSTADSSGRLEGRGVLGITLDSFELHGETYPVTSSLDTKTTDSHKKRNIEMIGGGAGLGALIGGIAGHGKGAAIGAAAGAAAGTGAAAATGRKDVEVPAETIFNFTLKAPVKVKG